jgi:hypothetical protein
MSGSIPPFPQYTFMAWCSVKKKGTGATLPLPFYRLCGPNMSMFIGIVNVKKPTLDLTNGIGLISVTLVFY